MEWTIEIPKRVVKSVDALPKLAQKAFYSLLADIRDTGPVQGQWKNYSKLSGNLHHCHIRQGKPCYVAVWEVTNKTIRLVEVKYVGTHEKAPY